MRYRLSTLLIVITLAAGLLAMCVRYGILGVLLYLPHLFAVLLLAWLVKRGRKRIAGGFAAAYIVCWLLTGTWGVSSVCGEFEQRASRPARIDGSEVKRISYRPTFDDPYGELWMSDLEGPWYYLGDESSPCPFVVTFEHGRMNKWDSGYGGRRFVLWVVGCELGAVEPVRWTVN